MEIQINNKADGTLETSFLDDQKSPCTHNGETYFDNTDTASDASNDEIVGAANGTSLTEVSPMEIEASDSQLTNNERSGSSVNPVAFLSVCSYVVLVVVIVLVVGLMLIPLILYYASLPSEDAALSSFNLLDYENCLVSFHKLLIEHSYCHECT